jgi:trimeric autotransporter adhesin
VRAVNARLVLSAILGAVLAIATLGCAEPHRPSLDVRPDARTLVAGESVQLTVTRRFLGGAFEDVTGQVVYATSDGAIAGVDSAGVLVAGRQPGAVIVRVHDPSTDASAVATFNVVAARIEEIEIAPSPAIVLATGTTLQFEAFARLSDGTTADVTKQVLWSSTNLAAAMVGNGAADKGVVTAVSPGDANILATDSATGIQGRTMLFVSGAAPQLAAIIVTPNPGTIMVAGTQAFTATGVLSDGTARDVTGEVAWSSSRTDVATIDAAGVATGVAAGDTTITATGGQAASTIRGSAAAEVTP